MVSPDYDPKTGIDPFLAVKDITGDGVPQIIVTVVKGNQMTAQNANFQAGQQSQMYNQGQRTQAAGQLGSYNNQRQGMLSDAEGRQIGVLGQQVFRGPETGLPAMQQQQPNFQQWSQAAPVQQPQASSGFQQWSQTQPQQPANNGLTGSVWAGSGRPSVGSGFTTSTFGPTQVGNPWGAGASVGTDQPAVNRGSIQAGDGVYKQKQQLPGQKVPVSDPYKGY